MITQPSTVVTINTSEQRRANSRVLLNALKPGTEQLIKAFKIGDRESTGSRKSRAIGMKAMKKQRGSAEQRRVVKMKNPPHMTHLYDKTGKFIGS